MVRKSYTPEQILNKLREAEILLNQGTALSVVWKKIGVSDCTYYRWRKEYGGMRIEQTKRLKELEQENSHSWLNPNAHANNHYFAKKAQHYLTLMLALLLSR